jgi:hypothetical protein
MLKQLILMLLFVCQQDAFAEPPALERIRVAEDAKSFVFEKSGKKFTPWGFNYDHDAKGRLIEDYWDADWDAIKGDFAEMKSLGANVVRIHIQFGKFMTAADKPNEKSLAKLGELLKLAESNGLYIDLTGLGCYHKKDVPAWYDDLSEADRWAAQAKFWEAVAKTCKESPAIFCYDLMNEPVSPGGKAKGNDWLGPAFGDKHFVQRISLDQKDRKRSDIAKAWIKQLATAIRKVDDKHLITVGLVDWSLDRPGLTSGFVPKEIAGDLDFLCVHIYPQKGKIDEAIETLKEFDVGKPIVIEETFPLKAPLDQFEDFLKKSEKHAAGVIGFYWGVPPDELRKSKELAAAILLAWLEVFQKRGRAIGVIAR